MSHATYASFEAPHGERRLLAAVLGIVIAAAALFSASGALPAPEAAAPGSMYSAMHLAIPAGAGEGTVYDYY